MSSNLILGLSEFNLKMDKPPVHKVYEFEDFRFDAAHLMLYRRHESIQLAPKAAETLLVFIEHRGQILSKEELIEQIWPNAFVEESNLFLYLSVLRKTLGNQKSGSPYLETLKRRGYRFNGTVQLISDGRWEEPQSAHSVQVIEPIDSVHPATTDSPVNDLQAYPSIWPQTNPVVNELPEPPRDWSLRRLSFAAIAVIGIVAALGLGYRYFFSPSSINSIAVMPFANESGDPKLEYLSDGLTGDLIESLSKVSGLEVKPLSTVVRYKGTNLDARTIGQELNVGAILFARVIESGEDDLTLQVDLVASRNGNSFWRHTYQKEGLVALQSELAQDLARKLSVPMTGKTQEKLAKHDTDNSDANRLYHRGVHQARKLTEQDINKAIELFYQAIQKDPEYARAYAAIATAQVSLTMCCDGQPLELVKAKDAAKKAVELDPELAEGHSALARLIWKYDWNWAEAEKEFLRALELDPNSSMSHFSYAEFLGRTGRRPEALVEGERARELEPLSPYFNAFGAQRDPEKAVERIRFAIDLDPNFYFSHLLASGIYSERGMQDEAIEESRLAKKLSPDQTWSDVGLSRILVNAGRTKEARAILDELLLRSKSRFVPPFHIALVYSYLGDKQQALEWLEKAYDIHDPKMPFLKTMKWGDVENDPRFKDIERRVGLPTQAKTASTIWSVQYILTGVRTHKIAAVLIAGLVIVGIVAAFYFKKVPRLSRL